MNTILFIVTILSLGSAVVLATLTWRLIREERRRSAARVEALLSAVAASPEPVTMSASAPDARVEGIAHTDLADPRLANREHPDLFHTTSEARVPFQRLAIPVALGILIVGTLVTVLFLAAGPTSPGGSVAAGPTSPSGSVAAGPSPSSGSVAATAVGSAGSTTSAPLELISLRHELTEDRLSITGLVRNPAGSRQLSGLNVVVFVFDRNGSLLTSLQGPLDFRTLAAGEESPFVVSLDKIGNVGRYRVSFRAADRVVPHVDRRQAPVVASVSRQ